MKDIEILVAGDFPKKDSSLDCQYKMIKTGMSPTEAAKECGIDPNLLNVPQRNSLVEISPLGTLIQSGGSHSAADCSDLSGSNPVAAGFGGVGPRGPGGVSASEGRNHPNDEDRRVAAAYALSKALDVVIIFIAPEYVAPEVVETVHKAKMIVDEIMDLAEEAPSNTTDPFPPPAPSPFEDIYHNGTTSPDPAQPVRDGQVTCLDAFAFMQHCQETNFKSVDCQKFKKGCEVFDSTIAMNSMVNPEGGDPCGMNTDPIDIKNIVLPCETTARPVDPDTNPCEVAFSTTRFDPCNSPDRHAPVANINPEGGPPEAKPGCPMTVIHLEGSELIKAVDVCPPDESGIIRTGCAPPGGEHPSPGDPRPGPRP